MLSREHFLAAAVFDSASWEVEKMWASPNIHLFFLQEAVNRRLKTLTFADLQSFFFPSSIIPTRPLHSSAIKI